MKYFNGNGAVYETRTVMTFTPGKLYRLKNCGWFVFRSYDRFVAIENGLLLFLKEENKEGLKGSNLFFLHEDKLLETDSVVSNNGRDLKEISQYMEEVV